MRVLEEEIDLKELRTINNRIKLFVCLFFTLVCGKPGGLMVSALESV